MFVKTSTRRKPPFHITTGVTTALIPKGASVFMMSGFPLQCTLTALIPKNPKWHNNSYLLPYLFTDVTLAHDLGLSL
jgi:hypothetical protein